MSLKDELTAAMIANYEKTKDEIGYCASRHRQAILRKGGLARARDMLRPRTKDQRSGLDRLIEANRPDLSVESLVVAPQFQELFSEDERSEALARLEEFKRAADVFHASKENLYPDDLPTGTYPEGAKKTVRVNKYERNQKARKKCIDHYGSSCSVCDFSFARRYGDIGKGFIHVHHLDPVAMKDGAYQLDPIADLRPVCPNCHAMLHRPDKALEITELQDLISKQGEQSPGCTLRRDPSADSVAGTASGG